MKERKIVPFDQSGQSGYLEKLRSLNEGKTYYIETYGCQMNVRDSQTLAGFLEAAGYERAESAAQADAVIFNTCCVREGAEERLLGNLGRLKKSADEKRFLAVGGCMMQEKGKAAHLRKRFPYVDVIFGTHNLHEFPRLMYEALTKNEPCDSVWEKEDGIVEAMPCKREKTVQAYVNIMFGCNNFCSYCIVPYVRGRERSRRSEDIVAEVRALVESGRREITLLGQNVNSYGGESELTFPGLLRELDKIDGLERLRFMTSHPKDLSDELIETMAGGKHICHYLHLPVQSGSDRILEKMNRRYTREKYLRLVEKLKQAMPDLALSTDIIVGFPGETEEDFRDTVSLYRAALFNNSFTFIYSPREGTPAAVMEDQVPAETSGRRLRELIAVADECTLAAAEKYRGNVYPVLVEGTGRAKPGTVAGRTEHGRMVCFEGPESLIGQTVNVKIEEIRLSALYGTRED